MQPHRENDAVRPPLHVIAGLDPAIHEAEQRMKIYGLNSLRVVMDCRIKSGNDEREVGGYHRTNARSEH
jgi:hypothetical protein